jgi:hypothetical protein
MKAKNFFMLLGKREAAFAAADLLLIRPRVDTISFGFVTGVSFDYDPTIVSAKGIR